MTPLSVANDTWAWLVGSGRVSGLAEQFVRDFGQDAFLQQAAERWQKAGCPRFMQGMKTIMLTMIWGE